MFIIGQPKETIDIDIFRNFVSRLITKTNSFVNTEAAKVPKPEDSIKGYFTPDKLKGLFDQKAPGVTQRGHQSFAHILEEMLKPFMRENDTLGNVNQAMSDLVKMAMDMSFSEMHTKKVMDVCAREFVHEKVHGITSEDAEAEKATSVILGLVDVYEIHFKELYSAETAEQRKQAISDFEIFITKVREIARDGAPSAHEHTKVIFLEGRRPGTGTVG